MTESSTQGPNARLVVGTGRCGSTLLSRMLSQNPGVLSLFEWFSGIDQFFRFRTDPIAGSELASRLKQDHPMLTAVLKRGYEVPEVAYPFGQNGARFDLGDPVPWCLGIALPRISQQPDQLFDALLDVVQLGVLSDQTQVSLLAVYVDFPAALREGRDRELHGANASAGCAFYEQAARLHARPSRQRPLAHAGLPFGVAEQQPQGERFPHGWILPEVSQRSFIVHRNVARA